MEEMAIIAAIADELRKGNVEKAFDLRRKLPKRLSEETEMEIVEIVRQSMLVYAKKGQIEKIQKAKKIFSIPTDIVNEIMKHAVLSIFSEGDMKTIKSLHKDVPIPKEIADEIIAYCASWNNADRLVAIKGVLA